MSISDVIFILGVPRSGTSALTRLLSLCGCGLPEAVFAAGDQNPRGHWEPVDAVKLNVEFLSRHNSMLGDPSMRLQEEDIDDSEREAYVGEIRRVLSCCNTGRPLILKELRIVEVMPFWLEAARKSGMRAKAIIAIRHPEEVLNSTRRAQRGVYAGQELPASVRAISRESFNASWLKTNLVAERTTRSLHRVVVAYDRVLADWRREVARVSQALELDLPADESAVEAFLSGDLRRQRCDGAVVETFGHSWVTRVYESLTGAAEGVPIDTASLDEIYHAYRADERTFRTAWEEFCGKRGATDSLQLPALGKADVWRSGKDY